MQISSTGYSIHSSAFTGSSSKSKSEGQPAKEAFDQFTNFSDSNNTLFQNLLKDPSVQGDVTVNEDGTYSFSHSGNTPWGDHEILAKLLISQQNGYTSSDDGAQTQYSANDLSKFKQMTGYNLFQAGGLYTVVDDNGNPPSGADQAMV